MSPKYTDVKYETTMFLMKYVEYLLTVDMYILPFISYPFIESKSGNFDQDIRAKTV